MIHAALATAFVYKMRCLHPGASCMRWHPGILGVSEA